MAKPATRQIPSHWLSLGSVLLAAAMLCWAAVWNGQAFFYPDTPTYLRGAEMGLLRLAPAGSLKPWLAPSETASPQASDLPAQPNTTAAPPRLTSIEDKVVLAGRSVYYGALLYVSHLVSAWSGLGSSLWLTVLVQALCVAYVLQLVMVRLWHLRPASYLAATAAMAVLTPVAVYTGFLMPDIFAGVLVLCVALLVTSWHQLSPADRWAVSALLLYALVVHASHAVIASGLWLMLVVALVWRPAWRLPGAGKGLGVLAACLLLAWLAEAAFVKAVTLTVGAPPLRLPHPMARLIDAGPGTDFLKKNCTPAESAQAPYAACAYVQNYPTAWVDFLFSSDPSKGAFALADPATKRRLSDEQLRFAWDVTRADPLGVARVVGTDVLRQLGRFETDVWSYGKDGIALYFQGRVPPDVLAAMQASRAAHSTAYNLWFSLSSQITVLASVLVLVHLAWTWPAQTRLSSVGQRHESRRLAAFTFIVLSGVIANALVCAALASSMDRFQARVIWLLPFMALSAWLVLRSRQAQSIDHFDHFEHPDSAESTAPSLLGAKP